MDVLYISSVTGFDMHFNGIDSIISDSKEEAQALSSHWQAISKKEAIENPVNTRKEKKSSLFLGQKAERLRYSLPDVI